MGELTFFNHSINPVCEISLGVWTAGVWGTLANEKPQILKTKYMSLQK